MNDTSLAAVYATLFFTGLVMSLHCIGMCGPILVSFASLWRQKRDERAVSLPVLADSLSPRESGGVRADAAGGEIVGSGIGDVRPSPQPSPEGRGGKSSMFVDFTCYHVGRLWTYGVLGLFAGAIGALVRQGSAWMGWHRAAGVAIGLVVAMTGVVLLGVTPGLKLDGLLDGCAVKRFGGWRWFQALLVGRGVWPRLLLGAVMGLLPCGLVYAMLAAAAALPTPWHAALGMIVFGLGTLPGLTGVLALSQAVPVKWRGHGMKLAAVMVVATGLFMAGRSFWMHDHRGHVDHQDHHDHSHMGH